MSLTGIDEKKLDAVLDNANGMIRELRGKLALIDAPLIAGLFCTLSDTANNLKDISEKLKKIAGKFD